MTAPNIWQDSLSFANDITGIGVLNLLEETLRKGCIPTSYSVHGTQYYIADG
ncbi:MAG: hypothetical protein ABSC50_04370 [Candidatus Bathyarchaeia archaeon]